MSEHYPVREYIIVLQGHLDERWLRWFEPLTITRLPGGSTMLSGPVADQAALHGVLSRIRDLGLGLLFLKRSDFDCKDEIFCDTKI